jgi:hypothetical protein
VDHGGGRGKEGVGRHQHVPALRPQRAQADLEGRRAAVHRDGVLDAAQLRELLFEGLAVLAEGELP